MLMGLGNGLTPNYTYAATNVLGYVFPNMAFGFDAGQTLTASTTSTTIGTGVYGTTAFGSFALQKAVSAGESSAFGSFALNNATGNYNTGVGMDAGRGITNGSSNTVVGNDAVITANGLSDQTIP